MRFYSRADIVRCLLAFSVLLGTALPLTAFVIPEESPVIEKQFYHPRFHVRQELRVGNQVDPTKAIGSLSRLRVDPQQAYLDPRTGRWATLVQSLPLLPGSGVGNDLTWQGLGLKAAPSDQDLRVAAWQAFSGYLAENQQNLGIDLEELQPARVTVHRGGDLVQIYVPRAIDGVPVRDSFLNGVINHGNLVLFGTRNWGDNVSPATPAISREAAASVVNGHIQPLASQGYWGRPGLSYVPLAIGSEPAKVEIGQGLEFRLVWSVRPRFQGEYGRWEALVDAHTGELISFEDTNHYASTRNVVGGVLPIANDGMNPDGIEQAGYPMPYADVENGGTTQFTDSAGNVLSCVDGDITSTLSGRYLRMDDQCGAISLSDSGDIDFGTSGGTDCTTPGFGGAGNTHSSRSGYYEISRVQEQARAFLPNNSWLGEQLTSVMNINLSCNAFWSGSTVNFYQSGGGCNNTGEIAGIYDHEWGHGMDANDAVPSISNPGEGIADIYASLRLNTSCIGRDFLGSPCGGYGDPCTSCTGVRDIDWANRDSGLPHDIGNTFPTGLDLLCGSGGGTPCGGSTHCEGAAYAEAVWDLWNRDLPSVFGLPVDTAREIAGELTYLGGGAVGNWFTCSPPFGGCNADGGYLNYLAADDDDGNLANGTPNMEAIFDAFNRHQIACATPAVNNNACNRPASAPANVMATPFDRGTLITWDPVAGADGYKIYRAEGVFQCDFGKEYLGETVLSTQFFDTELKNGFEYYYIVVPMGDTSTCLGPASSCTTVTPAAGENIACSGLEPTVSIITGDGDDFIDNGETVDVGFEVTNVGTGTLNNVRITDVRCSSHPGIDSSVTYPAQIVASLADCAVTTAGGFTFVGTDLAMGDTIQCTINVTADEVGAPGRNCAVTLGPAESDLQNVASITYDFESDDEGWEAQEGTFSRTSAGGGADSTSFYLSSSDNLADQCDHVRSPGILLTSTSTLSLSTQFEIEAEFTPGVWYDRANIGIYDPVSGTRTTVDPDGGRTYNASGANGTCGLADENGWGGVMDTWADSTWSATALGSAALAGQPIQLDVRYGTDALEQGFGFHFDQVTLTDIDLQIPDGQADTESGFVFSDGFESGDIDAWSFFINN